MLAGSVVPPFLTLMAIERKKEDLKQIAVVLSQLKFIMYILIKFILGFLAPYWHLELQGLLGMP